MVWSAEKELASGQFVPQNGVLTTTRHCRMNSKTDIQSRTALTGQTKKNFLKLLQFMDLGLLGTSLCKSSEHRSIQNNLSCVLIKPSHVSVCPSISPNDSVPFTKKYLKPNWVRNLCNFIVTWDHEVDFTPRKKMSRGLDFSLCYSSILRRTPWTIISTLEFTFSSPSFYYKCLSMTYGTFGYTKCFTPFKYHRFDRKKNQNTDACIHAL